MAPSPGLSRVFTAAQTNSRNGRGVGARVDHDAAFRLALGQFEISLAQLLVKIERLALEAVDRRIAAPLGGARKANARAEYPG